MKNEKKQKDDFRKELDAYQAQGIPLWLDGEPSIKFFCFFYIFYNDQYIL